MSPAIVTGPGVAPGAAPSGEDRLNLRRAAQAFEAQLFQALIKRMREAQLQQGFFGKTAGSSVYETMFDQYLGQRLAEDSPLGIATLLETRWTDGLDRREEARRAFSETLKFSTKLPMGGVSVVASVTGDDLGKP